MAGLVVQAMLQGGADCRLEVQRQLAGRIGAEWVAVHYLHSILLSLLTVLMQAAPCKDVHASGVQSAMPLHRGQSCMAVLSNSMHVR